MLKRRMLSVILVLALAISILPVGVFAYQPYVVDDSGILQTTSYVMTDSDPADGKVTISLKVKKGAQAAATQNALMIAAAKTGAGQALNNAAVASAALSDASPKTLSVDLECNPTEETIEVFLWDGYSLMNVLAEKAEYDEAFAVTNITLDGKSFTEFGASVNFDADVTTYDIPLAASYLNYPEIVVETTNLAAETTITPAEGSTMPATKQHDTEAKTSSVVVKASLGGVEKSYTLNFIQEAPAITNAQYKIWTDTTNKVNGGTTYVTGRVTDGEVTQPITYQKVLENPDWGGVNPRTDTRVSGNLSVGDVNYEELTEPLQCFADRPKQKLYDIAPELYGATMLQIPYGDNSSRLKYTDASAVGEADAALKFDINRTATIYVWAGLDGSTVREAFTNAGFALCNGALNYDVENDGADTVKDGVMAFKTIQDTNDVTSTGEKYEYSHSAQTHWMKKTVQVAPGAASAPVEIPAASGGYYFTMIKFHEGDNISDLVINTGAGTATPTDSSPVIQTLHETQWWDESTDTDGNIANLQTTNVMYANHLYIEPTSTSSSYYLRAVYGIDAVALKGAETFNTRWNTSNAQVINSIAFDINYSSKVYIFSSDKLNTEVNAALFADGWVGESTSLVAGFLTNDTGGTNTFKSTYSKEFQIVPGETEHISLAPVPTGRLVVAVVRTDLK